MTEKIRADVALVKKNLCDIRERAQAAIMEGRVFFGNRRINKASEMIDESETLVIRNPENDYDSRGALKLERQSGYLMQNWTGKLSWISDQVPAVLQMSVYETVQHMFIQ